MTPQEFIKKWLNSGLKERAAAQEHFIDLCRLLGERTPAEADPSGNDYAFEKGATKTTGGNGFADVFKRGHFGWEYKGTHANLDTAFAQLQRYAVALDNPPLLVVCDVGTTIRIHTNWTNSVSKTYVIPIAELGDAEKRGWLKAAFADPEALRPAKTRQQLTEEVAGEFAQLARSLRDRGHNPEEVAHFINRLVFCMFAEDVKLLSDNMFTRMLERAKEDPSEFEGFARDLFRAMSKGGRVGFEKVAWFNGGLFDSDKVFVLQPEEINLVHGAAKHYWGDIDPSILGTLFERGLDPDKRSQLGAHYTDRDKIMMIIEPVIIAPFAAEWEETKAEIEVLMNKAAAQNEAAKTKGGRAASNAVGQATAARNNAHAALERYLKRLTDFRVLDPACGSGNFLYLALRALKDLEHRALVEAEALGLPRRFPAIGPEVVHGIEINPYAAELARISVWIGEIQWMLKNGFEASRDPVLKPLETIECRDALLSEDGTSADWPDADAIIGNPPFLGSKYLRKGRPATKTKPALEGLGDAYVDRLYAAYKNKVPASADLVSYWFYNVHREINKGRVKAFGLIATKSIGKGASNKPLSDLIDGTEFAIFNAWRNEEWVINGTDVRVSIVCASINTNYFSLNGLPSGAINPDLTCGLDMGSAIKLPENRNKIFQGAKLNGPFEISSTLARKMLVAPTNPNMLRNCNVIKRFFGNDDVTMRDCDAWVIDFTDFPELESASLFELPFSHVQREVLTHRNGLAVARTTETDRLRYYWLMQRPRPSLRVAIAQYDHVIAVPETSEHILFRFLPQSGVFSGSLFVIAADDFTMFGIVSSRFHEVWARAQGNRLGAGNQGRYNATRTFQTFPFPEGLTPNIPAIAYAADPRAIAIAKAATRLNELRENWLNPADLVRFEPEVVPGYPDRILPSSPENAVELKKRTLTRLYNEHPTWLANAHKALDEAVAAAYGWPTDLTDNEVLARLLELNQVRANSVPIKD